MCYRNIRGNIYCKNSIKDAGLYCTRYVIDEKDVGVIGSE